MIETAMDVCSWILACRSETFSIASSVRRGGKREGEKNKKHIHTFYTLLVVTVISSSLCL